MVRRRVDNLRQQGAIFTCRAEASQDRDVFLCTSPDGSDTCDMLGPIWADDLAMMVDGDTPHLLLQRTQLITARVFDYFAMAGMDVNDLFRHQEPVLEVCTERIGTFHVRLVQQYKHLCTMYASGGRMIPEIRQDWDKQRRNSG